MRRWPGNWASICDCVRPSGEAGRITADDVQAYVRETNEQVAAGTPRGVTPPGQAASDDYGAVRIEKMSRMRQTIARNMLHSYTTIPQLTNFDDADVTELEEMRQQSKDDYAARGIKLTAMPFLIKAVASSLRKHPIVNASVDMENHQIIYKEYVNIGVAVDTDRGLLVPGVAKRRPQEHLADRDRARSARQDGPRRRAFARRHARRHVHDQQPGRDRRHVFHADHQSARGGDPAGRPLAARCRKWSATPVEPRLMMPLSITYDHRVVDGAAAARFLNEVKGYLAAPGRLLLAP